MEIHIDHKYQIISCFLLVLRTEELGCLFSLVQVDDVLLAGGLGAHLQHLHLAARHLPADGPVEGGEGDVFNLPVLHHWETFLFSTGLKIKQCWLTLILCIILLTLFGLDVMAMASSHSLVTPR